MAKELGAKAETEPKLKVEAKRERKIKVEKEELIKRAKREESKSFRSSKPSYTDMVKKALSHRKANVKKESGKRKRKATAKRRNASREAMNRPVMLSEELQALLGEKALSRPETVSKVWALAKERNLLNPSNRKEIQCDAELRALFGQDTVSLMDMQRVLMPHFDYSSKVEAKTEVKRAMKRSKEEELKEEAKEAKSEAKSEAKAEAKAEVKAEVKQEKWKATDFTWRLTGLFAERLSLEVSCSAVCPALQIVAATPGKELRKDVKFIAREAGDGFESFAEPCIEGLDPHSAYTLRLEIDQSLIASISVPQRAAPQSWSSHEVQLWSTSLQVPDLSKKLAEYRIDGQTLLTLEEALLHISLESQKVLLSVLLSSPVCDNGRA